MNKTFKKALSLVLMLMMVVSTMVIVPLTASAEDAALGTAANPIKVGTVAEFKALDVSLKDAEENLTSPIASATNDPETGYIYIELTADLDFDTDPGEGITRGAAQIKLNGYTLCIDGKNHTVKNYALNGSNSGLFGFLSSNCVVKNIHVSNAVATNCSANSGLIVAYGNPGFAMYNCSTDASCSVTGTGGHLGGLVGSFSNNATEKTFTMENCVNNAVVTNTGGQAAGLCGNVWIPGENKSPWTMGSTAYFTNCVNNGTINGANAGGITAQFERGEGIRFTNCVNNGTVTATGHAGGMIGKIGYNNNDPKVTMEFQNCVNLKAITGTVGTADVGAGGMIGYGFVVAKLNPTWVFNRCVNVAPITGTVNAGGLIGLAGGPINFDVDYCANIGDIMTTATTTNWGRGVLEVLWVPCCTIPPRFIMSPSSRTAITLEA